MIKFIYLLFGLDILLTEMYKFAIITLSDF